jgi:peroxiredoxin
MPAVGETAPDFELNDQSNQPVRLSDFRGKKHVIVLFYPMSFTRVCSSELCTLRDDLGAYQNEDAKLLAISVDSSPVHKRFAEQQGFEFPLLADFWPHGEVAKRYGVFQDDFGVAARGTFLVDRDGVIRYTTVNAISDARDQQDLKTALAQLDS